MAKKHCLFCDEIVPIEAKGNYDRYIGCDCSPEGFYSLLRDSYEPIYALPHQVKRQMFPLVSAYIRELTDYGEEVTLSSKDLDTLTNSPRIPVNLEEKGSRFLQYLYRHSEGPGESVIIQPLSHRYNLTYSPNLQELVYIIDMLRNEQSIIREGMTFKLTEKGWSEAAARAGGRKLKPCFILISGDDKLCKEWSNGVLPKIEQFGYLPRLFNCGGTENREQYSAQLISESKLVVADLSGQSAEVYFAAGYALGVGVPVIWTVNSSDADNLSVQTDNIRPLVWDTTEELAAKLQQRLNL